MKLFDTVVPAHFSKLWATYTWDRDGYRVIHQGLQRDWLDHPMLYTTYTGDGRFQIPAMLLAIVFKPTRVYGAATLAAFLLSGAVRLIIKELVGRQRPSNYDFARPLEDIYGYTSSFPSGHSTTSFAIGFTLFLAFRGTKLAWIGQLSLLWSLLAGFSRIYIGVHYPGDVLGGMGLGMAGAAVIVLWFRKKGWLPQTGLTEEAEELEEELPGPRSQEPSM